MDPLHRQEHQGPNINKKNGFLSLVQLIKLSLFVALISVPIYSIEGPQGGHITAGQATINQTQQATQIHQASDKVIINWQSYNINQHESVHYQQPHAGAIALNRINPAQGASQIFGQLTANGQVWLINPAGIWFGPHAHVNVGGLLATTGNISDQDFLTGHYVFKQSGSWDGIIQNEGTIKTSEAGLVALVGSGVINHGYIEANLGTVILGAGQDFTLHFSGNQLINFSIDKEVVQPGIDANGRPLKEGINNTGAIIANGGKIYISSRTASQVLDHAINMQGIAQANTVGIKNGEIILYEKGQGTVKVSGQLIASAPQAKGGKIKILGKRVALTEKAQIDVSGAHGGGEVLIGGDYQGKNSNIKNAVQTYIGPNVSIHADAKIKGDGGKVIIWADDTAQFYGSITARGGPFGGDGGFIETSGKNFLEILGGRVDANAPQGSSGVWLLDPRNVTISAITSGGAFSGGDPDVFTPNANNATIDVATINSSLNAGTSVTITTGTESDGTQAGNINVNNAILKSAGLTTPTLKLEAHGSIFINTDIGATSGSLNIDFLSGNVIRIGNTASATLSTNDGTFTGQSQNAFQFGINANTGTLNTGSGTVTILANQDAAGSQGFSMTDGSSISTTNASPNAVAITVNTAGGGAGNAALSSITVGDGGTLSVVTAPAGNVVGNDIIQNSGSLVTGSGNVILTTAQASGRNIGTAVSPISIQAGSLTATTGGAGIFIANTGTTGLTLNVINSTGGMSLTSLNSADISDSGILTISGTTAISAGATQNVSLNSVANNFATLSFLSAHNVEVVDADTLILGTSNIDGSLDMTTGGSITQSGILTVAGLPTFNFSAPLSDLSLASQANNFSMTPIITDNGQVRDILLRNVNTNAAVPTIPAGLRNLTLIFDNASALTLPQLTLTGFLSVSTNAPIQQSGALTIAGTSTLAAGTLNDITLDQNNNDFSTLTISSAKDVTIVDTNALNLSNSVISGNLTASANGNITDGGTLNIAGLALFTAGTNNIVLNNAANDFASVGVISADNVTLRDANAINLAASTMDGNLTVTSDGAITQSGVLMVAGTAAFNAGASHNITLDAFNNAFNTVRINDGNDVKLKSADDLNLAASTVSGNFEVTSGGNITQNGVLTIIGTPTFTLTTPETNISLASRTNDFSMTPIITDNGNVESLLLRNVAVNAAVPTLPGSLKELTLTYDNAAIALPSINLTDLTITSGGNVTQTGPLTIAQNANFNAGSQNIILEQTLNNFNLIRIISANDVTLVDRDALEFRGGSSTVLGILNVNTGGTLSQNNPLNVTGLTILNTNANDIAFNNSSNDFSTVQILSANNVVLRDRNHLDLGTSTIDGSLTLRTTGGGGMSQSGAITVAGITTLIAGDNDIAFNTHDNQFNTITINSANNVDILDMNELDLGSSTVSGSLFVTTGGTLTQSDNLNVIGLPTFRVSALNSDILLDTESNNFQITPIFTTTGAGTIRDLGLKNISASAAIPNLPSTLRNLSLIFTVPVTQNFALSGSGTLSVKTLNNLAGAAPINLNTFNNIFAAINLNTRNAADTNNVASPIHYQSTSGYDSFIQSAGAIDLRSDDLINSMGIVTAGTLNIQADRLLGLINVGDTLTINLSTGNFSGTVKGLSGAAAIKTFVVLNKLMPATIFFDGIDIYTVFNPIIPPLPPSPPDTRFIVPAQIVFPTNYMSVDESQGGLKTTMQELLFAWAMTEGIPSEHSPKKISSRCTQVSPLITVCDIH